MPLYYDQLGKELQIEQVPRRIVSLVPSQTELLFDLGLDEEVVGITKFCVHPQHWFRSKTRVGGTKSLDIARISSLEPDLIIANKEENVREQVDALSARWPVYTSDVNNLGAAHEMIRTIGAITGAPAAAGKISTGIDSAFTALYHKLPPNNPRLDVLYMIWRDPYMAAGGDTFINDMLERCGLRNAIGHLKRYPEINGITLKALSPARVLLSSEPYPFKEKHAEELRELLPHATIDLVDGELFSWYGSRLLQSPAYYEKLFVH